MFYRVCRQSPYHRKITPEEIFAGKLSSAPIIPRTYDTIARTYSDYTPCDANVEYLVNVLKSFNEKKEYLRQVERQSLYNTFYVPKKSGGLRRIDAPCDDLKLALRDLKEIFERDFGALYHTSAFAYVKGRCNVDAVKKHQQNGSKWFLKLDLHDFFGSTTLDFVIKMLSYIYPFNWVISDEQGNRELRKALDLAFLNGGLPQGTPLSPTITNIMMIPVDFILSRDLDDFEKQHYVYTRYADDFLISSKYDFDFKKIENIVVGVLKKVNAPFNINEKKTRYGSSNGSNWNLGVMLNNKNEITIGYKRKRQFQSMLHNYVVDKTNGAPWSYHDVKVLHGLYSYYHMVEPENIDGIISHFNQKHSVNVLSIIASDIKSAA